VKDAAEKDRLGEKLRDAEHGREDQFFAERDRQLIEKLRHAKAPDAKATRQDGVLMRCPKCDEHLQRRRLHGVCVDECASCHGVWLDAGDLERIASQESDGWIARWLRREFPEGE
jgi:hypothetical protein